MYTMVLICIGSILSCKNDKSRYRITNYLVNDSISKTKIIEEVEESLQLLVDGIVEQDADKIFAIFSKVNETRYVRNGDVYKSVDYARKSYAGAFRNRPDSIARKFTFTTKQYDILDANTVFLSAIGVIEKIKPQKDDIPWQIAYTILWLREEQGWKAINMHISWE